MDTELDAADGLDRETLRHLSRRCDARGFLQLGAHALLLAIAGFLVFKSHGLLALPALVAYGIVLDFLFCAMHECVHRTAFASRRINDAMAWLAGTLLLLPPEYFRAFHFAHHRFTQDPARDPELAQLPPTTLGAYLWRVTGIPNWTQSLRTTLRHALTGRVTEPFVAVGKQAAIVREARILWLLYAAVLALSIALKSSVVLWYWIVPAMLGQPFLRLYLLAEHTGCARNASMYENTRTIRSNAALRLLAWQMPYHVEHHAFPAVPFHRLASVHELIRARIRVQASGYFMLHVALIRGLTSAGEL